MESRWTRWVKHFEKNETRPDLSISTDPAATPEMLRTLALLQRAETGEGRIAKAIEQVDYRNIDNEYRSALRMFLREEARHAGLLGELLKAHGRRPITHTWRDGIFARVRRFAGVRFKLFVFLCAEVSAILVFSLLATHLGEGSIRTALARMLGDEERHLEFHAEVFRSMYTTVWARLIFRTVFVPVVTAGAIVMVLDHQRTLAELGVRPRQIARRFAQILSRALEHAAPLTTRMIVSA
jgi:hypothetical protein